MALHYNLSKFYADPNHNQEALYETIDYFSLEIPFLLDLLKLAIKEKNYAMVFSNIQKIKPTLDFLGLDASIEELEQIEKWSVTEGKKKEVKETFKSVQHLVEKAIKEINKDFKLIYRR